MGEDAAIPRLVLIAGVTGSGKTTTAKAVAHELGLARIASTDTIREVMRLASSPGADPALHRSSFAHGEVGEAVNDWHDAARAVEPGIEAILARARGHGVDIVLEGVHVIPANRMLAAWREAGGAAVGIVVKIEDEETPRTRLLERESLTWRGSDRYMHAFERIRSISRNIEERGAGAGWKVIDTHLHKAPTEMVKQWLDEAWYAAKRRLN